MATVPIASSNGLRCRSRPTKCSCLRVEGPGVSEEYFGVLGQGPSLVLESVYLRLVQVLAEDSAVRLPVIGGL